MNLKSRMDLVFNSIIISSDCLCVKEEVSDRLILNSGWR